MLAMIRSADDVIYSLTRGGTLADFREVGDAVQKIADIRLKNICMVNGTEINQAEINAVAWKACDTFRGVVDPSEY